MSLTFNLSERSWGPPETLESSGNHSDGKPWIYTCAVEYKLCRGRWDPGLKATGGTAALYPTSPTVTSLNEPFCFYGWAQVLKSVKHAAGSLGFSASIWTINPTAARPERRANNKQMEQVRTNSLCCCNRSPFNEKSDRKHKRYICRRADYLQLRFFPR